MARARARARVASLRLDQLQLAVAELLAARGASLAGGGEAATVDELRAREEDLTMMYEFKVRRCPLSRAHDWTSCPYAHPGEAARRRDPRRAAYDGDPCPDFRNGACPRGARCPLAHGTFELWLHPSRYRTRPCLSGSLCTRRVCFFAHNDRELRIAGGAVDTLSPRSPSTTWEYSPPVSPTEAKYQLQPAERASMGMGMDMDMGMDILAMQLINARDVMEEEEEEEESRAEWMPDLLMTYA
ncbi:zinc finger CCCH domain-containing protein 10-like [Oryza brachyantha]|uniref:zinc finger CCCH domain-containing protein 10-like n=1 Tax=Oryza brachyantha TaxID=4533 RepID=UPI001ADA4E0E|nr:zinc finger CCCH domain-containing protein 10-like [Oryza brachyantha]